jgi:hypothetical protein
MCSHGVYHFSLKKVRPIPRYSARVATGGEAVLMPIGAAVEMLNALLDVYPDVDLSDYSPSPQLPLVAPPMMDVDEVVGVVPHIQRRKGHFTAIQQGSNKLAEVYRLLREQTEDAGEIRLPNREGGQGEGGQVRQRNTLEVWGSGNLDVGTWDYDEM